MNDIKRKQVATTIRKTDAPRVFQFTISTGAVDRERDTIAPGGWRLESYRKNPVVLFGHRHDEPPVGRARSVGVRDGALVAVVEFPEPGVYERADVIRRLVEQDFLRATSVGFRPIKSVYNEARRGTDFLEQELLEFSIVSVPANAEALLVGPVKSLDRAALDRFFAAPRRGLDLDGVTPDEICAAVREVVTVEARRCTTEAVERARPLSLAEQMFDFDALVGGAEDDVPSAAEIGEALRETLPALVGAAVGRAVRQAQGKLD